MKNFIIFVLIFGYYEAVSGQNPEITENILPVIKRVGETSEMDCVVIRQNDNKVYWIHKNEGTVISSDETIEVDPKLNPITDGYPKYMVRKTVKGDKNMYTLIINNLEPRDAGTYTCQIKFRGSDQYPTKDGQLVVLAAPSIVTMLTTQAMSVNEGDSFNLTCQANGHPKPNITWVRGNGNALPNGKMRVMQKWLQIDKIKSDERGVFRCLADNNVRPTAQFDVTVTVYFPPVARAVQSSYGQAHSRNFDVTLECTIGGFPEPDLRWYKRNSAGNWDPITNDDKHIINILLNHANVLAIHERWFQLVIRTVTANDYGTYICAGSNRLGQNHGEVYLYETTECQGANCPEEQDPAKSGSGVTRFTSVMILSALLSSTYLLWETHLT